MLSVVSVQSVLAQDMAFNSQLSPGSKVFEVNRGDEFTMDITYTNMVPTTAEIALSAQDFFYGQGGVEQYVPSEDIESGKSLSQWITMPSTLTAPQNEKVKVSLTVKVPEDAGYGDHHAVIYFSNAIPQSADTKLVGIQGRLASLITVKVLGGEPVISGKVRDFDIQTREKARNTATFQFFFQNTGSEFFDIETIVEIYEEEKPAENVEPIKVLQKQDSVFPNIGKTVKVSLGDLGDDYGEGTYYAHILVQQKASPETRRRFFEQIMPFEYYVPLQSSALASDSQTPLVQREVVEVTPPLVEIVKELGLYIGLFVIVLLILVRVLFFPAGVGQKKKQKSRR